MGKVETVAKKKGSGRSKQGQARPNKQRQGNPGPQAKDAAVPEAKEANAPAARQPSQRQPRFAKPAASTKSRGKTPAEAAKFGADQPSQARVRPAAQQSTPDEVSEMRRPAAPTPEQSLADTRTWLIKQLQKTLQEGKSEVAGIRRRLQITYWAMIVLTIGLFVFGAALIGFPALSYSRGTIEEVTFGALGGAGALVIGLLLYFRPLERLQSMLADATYVSLIKDSFQYQVTLRLLALDLDDVKTVSEAASHVGEAAQASMDLVYTQLQARRASGG